MSIYIFYNPMVGCALLRQELGTPGMSLAIALPKSVRTGICGRKKCARSLKRPTIQR
jgi:hypothetical protein